MPDSVEQAQTRTPAPVLYIANFSDPADWFDLAYLLRSPVHHVLGVCRPPGSAFLERRLNQLFDLCGKRPPLLDNRAALEVALTGALEPVNLVVTSFCGPVSDLQQENRALFRQTVARFFIVGGHANDYRRGRAGERLPIDPRLKELHPERFSPDGDFRLDGHSQMAFNGMVASGEAVIWLPRDICLWRFAAPGMLAGGGPVCDFLLTEVLTATGDPFLISELADLPKSADAPVLLSSLPALLLAVEPDPFAWMRLFRAVPARVEIEWERSEITAIATNPETPNLYAVIAIDSAALSKFLAAALREQ